VSAAVATAIKKFVSSEVGYEWAVAPAIKKVVSAVAASIKKIVSAVALQ
jgi:hypothetical protein